MAQGEETDTRAEMVGGPRCGERFPVFHRAVDVVAAGKAYTVRIPCESWGEDAAYVYELRFRPDRHDGTLMRAILWYCGVVAG
jgi:hypothetical protein